MKIYVFSCSQGREIAVIQAESVAEAFIHLAYAQTGEIELEELAYWVEQKAEFWTIVSERDSKTPGTILTTTYETDEGFKVH